MAGGEERNARNKAKGEISKQRFMGKPKYQKEERRKLMRWNGKERRMAKMDEKKRRTKLRR